MTHRYIKLTLTLLTIAGCLTLPFLMTILRKTYSIDLNDLSVENFQRYKTQLVPTRDFILYSIVAACFTLSAWTFIDYRSKKLISDFDILSSIIFVLVGGLIVLIKTMLPTGPFF